MLPVGHCFVTKNPIAMQKEKSTKTKAIDPKSK
jgi:hypothetical protein